jgi:hypothetical protein
MKRQREQLEQKSVIRNLLSTRHLCSIQVKRILVDEEKKLLKRTSETYLQENNLLVLLPIMVRLEFWIRNSQEIYQIYTENERRDCYTYSAVGYPRITGHVD